MMEVAALSGGRSRASDIHSEGSSNRESTKVIKELLDSLRKESVTRLRNPLLGGFALAWVAVNWRLLAVLFLSSNAVENRIALIEEKYWSFSYVLWWPLGVAVVLAALLPYATLGLEKFQGKANRLRRLEKIDEETKVLLASREMAAAQTEIEEIRAQGAAAKAQREDLARLEDVEEAKRAEKVQFESQIRDLMATISDLRSKEAEGSEVHIQQLARLESELKHLRAEKEKAEQEVRSAREDRLERARDVDFASTAAISHFVKQVQEFGAEVSNISLRAGGDGALPFPVQHILSMVEPLAKNRIEAFSNSDLITIRHSLDVVLNDWRMKRTQGEPDRVLEMFLQASRNLVGAIDDYIG